MLGSSYLAAQDPVKVPNNVSKEYEDEFEKGLDELIKEFDEFSNQNVDEFNETVRRYQKEVIFYEPVHELRCEF